MDERAIVLSDWPQPTTVAQPGIWANEHSLLLRYRAADESFAAVRFPLCTYVVFGAPNDEALSGHPLYGRGLQFYSVHEVINSTLIAALEQRNSVHPRHDRERYLRDRKHYVFTFQDSTLECVVNEIQGRKPSVETFARECDAVEWLQEIA